MGHIERKKQGKQEEIIEEKIRKAVKEAGGELLPGAQSQLNPEEYARACKIAQEIKRQKESS